MVFLTSIEKLSKFFLHISQMLNMTTVGNTADIYAIVHLVPHTCQHITVNQSHSSGDTVEKIWRLAGSGGTQTVSFTNPQKKNSHGVKSEDQGCHRINASSFFSCASYPPLWQVSIEILSHVFVVSPRAVLLKDVIITVFIQL